ncbi:hypothetical protein PVAND_009417 [Polypedilum vanderplanki]|uniref:Cytochrome P450 n=1 Tax=Polypedilum vanderplanki TaxID=319348 RepID=A0A9J6CDG5_POLVA|nr:hypothetical protein PVAND_009417 [Polypedilum vanderplanki]
MMQPKIVNIYTQQFDEIAKEFIQIMKKLKNNRSEMPKDFFQYLTKWSLETIATVSIEKRLNIFNGKTDDERSKKYMEVSAQFFDKLTDFELMPSIWKYYQTKYFKELMNVYDTMAKITFSYIEEAIKKFETERFKEVQEESILRKLLKINKQIAFVIAGDILMPDMVAAATNFTLYFLAKNLEKQEKLRSEVMKILPNKNSSIEPKSLQNMPYLKAVIKESLRLQPIVSGNSRELAKDVVLAGYHVPKGTMIFMNAYIELSNPKYYPNPEKFIPERWLRDQQNENWKSKEYNAFSYLLFGFGSRQDLKSFKKDFLIKFVFFVDLALENVLLNFKWKF